MNDLVLDSCALNALLRTPGKANGKEHHRRDPVTALAVERRLRIVVDKDLVLESEWRKTCSQELVQALIVQWVDAGAFKRLSFQPTLPHELKNQLKGLGFCDTVDKVVVAIALCTTDRHIVTEDQDFWDPINPSNAGLPEAPVAKLLRKEHHVEVFKLKQYFADASSALALKSESRPNKTMQPARARARSASPRPRR